MVNVSEAIGGIINTLDEAGVLIPTLVAGVAMAGKALKNLAGFGGADDSVIQFRMVEGVLKQVQTQAVRTTPLIGNMWSAFKQGTTVSGKVNGALGVVGSTVSGKVLPALKGLGLASLKALGGMLAFQGVIWVIQALAKAWDKATNGVRKAGEEIGKLVEKQQGEIDANKEKVRVLETTGKKYEELASKAERSAEEEEEMLRLGNELAEVLPNIKIGTDEDGNAIISMTEDMDGYILSINEAIQRQEVLKAGSVSDQSSNALKMLTEGEFAGKNKDGYFEQRKNIQKAYNREMAGLQETYINTMLLASNSEGELKQQALADAEKVRQEMLNVESEYGNQYSDIQSKIIADTEKFRQQAYSSFSTSFGFKELTDENRKAVESFIASLDFSEVNSEQELDGLKRMFRELPDLVNRGVVDISSYNDSLKNLNSEYSKTGNLKEYNKGVDELAKKLSDESGWDVSLIKEMFSTMENGFLKSSNNLDTFLSKFGKTWKDVANNDELAKGLQAQYNSLERHIEAISGMTGDSKVDVKILTNLISDGDLPKQISDFARTLSNMGMSEQVVLPMVASLMVDLKDGKIDNLDAVKQELANQLMNMGDGEAYNTAVELVADIANMDVKDLKKQVEDRINSGGMKVKKTVEVTDNGTAEEVAKKLSALDNKPDVKHLFETEVIGMDELDFYLNLIKNFPANSDFTSNFIVDNHEALSKMDSYKEVLEWFNKQPKEFRQKYGVEGTEKVKKQLDEINEKKDEVGEPVKPKVDTGELEGTVEDFNALIEASAKVKDGVYNLTFKTDTASAIENINNLTDATKKLTDLFTKKLPPLVFKTETAQGSKNITGLKNNIKSYNDTTKGLKTLTFKTETALASKNVTGLRNNVSSYIKSYGGKNFSTKLSTQTALASQNISGLRRNIQSYINSYAGKTYTTTFKVVRIGSAPSTGGGGRGESVNADASMGQPIPAQTFGLTTPAPASGISTFTSPLPKTPTTDGHAPSLMNYSNPMEVINSGMNYFVEIENVINKLNGQMSILEEKMENSFGSKRIGFLKQQIALFEQQRSAQASLLKELSTYQSKLKSYLSGKGFKFDADGNIENYHTKLMGMEKELKRLEGIANKEDATDKQKKALEDYQKSYEEIKKAMDEYIQTTFTDMPNAQAEWEGLANEIENAKQEMVEIAREIEKLVNEAKVETLTDGFRDLAHELNVIDKLLEHATGTEKIDLMSKKIELLKKQQQELQKQMDFFNGQKSGLQKELGSLGFTFDGDGDITNYAKQLEYLANNSKDFEHIQEKLAEYLELQNEKLPEAEENWLDLDNAIKDAFKEQLNITAEMEKKITDIYKKQVQDRIDAMDKETEAKVSALKKQQDAYNKYREEADYDDEYDEKLNAVTDLQKQLDIAMKDTSLSGQKRVKELQKMLADAQKDLEDLAQEKIDKDVNEMFDKEQERLDEENEKAKENLENEWDDSKIAEMVSKALGSGVFTDIEGNVSSLEDALINFAGESGELFGVLGSTIQTELITNLGIARDTVKDLDKILKGLDVDGAISWNPQQSGRTAPPPSQPNVNVTFSSPLVVVEGGVDSSNIGDLEKMIQETEKRIVKNIVDSMNG